MKKTFLLFIFIFHFFDSECQIYFANDYGAKGDSITDNTAILQGLIDTVIKNGGGVIELGTGIYKITSTLIIPVAGQTMASSVSITIRGQFPPQHEFWYLQTPVPYVEGKLKGTVLMNLSGTVISSNAITVHKIIVENITIMTSDNPSWDALNFSKIVDMYVKNVVVTTGKHGSNASYPTHPNTCALRMTGRGFNFSKVENFTCHNFYVGIEMNEHAQVDNSFIMNCVTAFQAGVMSDHAVVNYTTVIMCNYFITFTSGPSYVNFTDIDQEFVYSGPYKKIMDVQDPNNYGYGKLIWHNAQHDWRVNGGTNLNIKELSYKEQSSGSIQGKKISYGNISTITGWNGPPARRDIFYQVNGDEVTVMFNLAGTLPSGTSMSFTLPFNVTSVQLNTCIHYVVDNGNLSPSVLGLVSCVIGSNIVNLYPSNAGGPWSSGGGNRAAIGQFKYFK